MTQNREKKEVLKQPLSVLPEHIGPHNVLLTTTGWQPSDPRRTAEARIATTLVINDMFSCPQFDGGIVQLTPSPVFAARVRGNFWYEEDPAAKKADFAHTLMASLILPPGSPLLETQYQNRYRGLPFHTGQQVHKSHIRDHFILCRSSEGETIMLVPLHFSSEPDLDRLASLADHLGIRVAISSSYFEGGNFLGDGRYNYTLSDTDRDNAYLDPDFSPKIAAIFGETGTKRIYLDHGIDIPQPVYHLDLAVSFIEGPDGKTVALLSSLSLAKKLLLEAGMRGNVNTKDWFRYFVAKDYQPRNLRLLARELERESLAVDSFYSRILARAREQGIDTEGMVDFAGTFIQQNIPLPGETMRTIGGGLRMIFGRDNYLPIQKHLDTIGEQLAKCGIRIVEIPALIISFENKHVLSRHGLDKEFVHQTGISDTPIYCPVNGLAYNGPSRLFLSCGGILPFDRYIQAKLARLGYQYVPLKNALSLGWALAGPHCEFIPYQLDRQENQ